MAAAMVTTDELMGPDYSLYKTNVNGPIRFTLQSQKKTTAGRLLPMPPDPQQRRAAMLAFMTTHKLKPYPWAIASGRSESMIRSFVRGTTRTLTDAAYEDLAKGAAVILERPVTAAEIRGEA